MDVTKASTVIIEDRLFLTTINVKQIFAVQYSNNRPKSFTCLYCTKLMRGIPYWHNPICNYWVTRLIRKISIEVNWRWWCRATDFSWVLLIWMCMSVFIPFKVAVCSSVSSGLVAIIITVSITFHYYLNLTKVLENNPPEEEEGMNAVIGLSDDWIGIGLGFYFFTITSNRNGIKLKRHSLAHQSSDTISLGLKLSGVIGRWGEWQMTIPRGSPTTPITVWLSFALYWIFQFLFSGTSLPDFKVR